MIYAVLAPELTKIIASSDRFGEGLVHIERTQLEATRPDLKRYEKIMQQCLGRYGDAYRTMASVLGTIAVPISDRSPSNETYL